MKLGKNLYAVNATRINGKGITLLMHRVILGLNDSKICVDHINRNSLDNRKSNLRFANKSQNAANQEAPKNNRSGFKGVFKAVLKTKTVYRARIWNRGLVHIGTYNNPTDAAKAYNLAAIKLFGEFACINNIPT